MAISLSNPSPRSVMIPQNPTPQIQQIYVGPCTLRGVYLAESQGVGDVETDIYDSVGTPTTAAVMNLNTHAAESFRDTFPDGVPFYNGIYAYQLVGEVQGGYQVTPGIVP